MSAWLERRNRLLELLAIFVSILLAFAIDAWWEEHREREREAEVLLDLAEELKRNVAELEGDAGWLIGQALIRNSAATLLESFHGLEPEYAERHQSMRIDWGDAIEFERRLFSGTLVDQATVPLESLVLIAGAPTWGPRLGTLDLLIQSGALLDLEDEELRTRLSALPARLDDMIDEENEHRDLVVTATVPALSDAGVPSAIFRFPFSPDGEERSRSRGVEPLPEPDLVVNVTPELARAVSRLYSQVYMQHIEMVLLRNEFVEIISLIEHHED